MTPDERAAFTAPTLAAYEREGIPYFSPPGCGTTG